MKMNKQKVYLHMAIPHTSVRRDVKIKQYNLYEFTLHLNFIGEFLFGHFYFSSFRFRFSQIGHEWNGVDCRMSAKENSLYCYSNKA